MPEGYWTSVNPPIHDEIEEIRQRRQQAENNLLHAATKTRVQHAQPFQQNSGGGCSPSDQKCFACQDCKTGHNGWPWCTGQNAWPACENGGGGGGGGGGKGGKQKGGGGGKKSHHKDRGHGGGGEGAKLLGPSALGRYSPLGNVPAGSTGGGISPVGIVVILGVVGIGGWYLYHKIHHEGAADKVATREANQGGG